MSLLKNICIYDGNIILKRNAIFDSIFLLKKKKSELFYLHLARIILFLKSQLNHNSAFELLERNKLTNSKRKLNLNNVTIQNKINHSICFLKKYSRVQIISSKDFTSSHAFLNYKCINKKQHFSTRHGIQSDSIYELESVDDLKRQISFDIAFLNDFVHSKKKEKNAMESSESSVSRFTSDDRRAATSILTVLNIINSTNDSLAGNQIENEEFFNNLWILLSKTIKILFISLSQGGAKSHAFINSLKEILNSLPNIELFSNLSFYNSILFLLEKDLSTKEIQEIFKIIGSSYELQHDDFFQFLEYVKYFPESNFIKFISYIISNDQLWEQLNTNPVLFFRICKECMKNNYFESFHHLSGWCEELPTKNERMRANMFVILSEISRYSTNTKVAEFLSLRSDILNNAKITTIKNDLLFFLLKTLLNVGNINKISFFLKEVNFSEKLTSEQKNLLVNAITTNNLYDSQEGVDFLNQIINSCLFDSSQFLKIILFHSAYGRTSDVLSVLNTMKVKKVEILPAHLKYLAIAANRSCDINNIDEIIIQFKESKICPSFDDFKMLADITVVYYSINKFKNLIDCVVDLNPKISDGFIATVLSCSSKFGMINLSLNILKRFVSSIESLNADIIDSLMQCYNEAGLPKDAYTSWKMFRKLSIKRNTDSYNEILKICLKNPAFSTSTVEYMNILLKAGLQPNLNTFSLLSTYYAKKNDFNSFNRLILFMKSNNLKLPLSSLHDIYFSTSSSFIKGLIIPLLTDFEKKIFLLSYIDKYLLLRIYSNSNGEILSANIDLGFKHMSINLPFLRANYGLYLYNNNKQKEANKEFEIFFKALEQDELNEMMFNEPFSVTISSFNDLILLFHKQNRLRYEGRVWKVFEKFLDARFAVISSLVKVTKTTAFQEIQTLFDHYLNFLISHKEAGTLKSEMYDFLENYNLISRNFSEEFWQKKSYVGCFFDFKICNITLFQALVRNYAPNSRFLREKGSTLQKIFVSKEYDKNFNDFAEWVSMLNIKEFKVSYELRTAYMECFRKFVASNTKREEKIETIRFFKPLISFIVSPRQIISQFRKLNLNTLGIEKSQSHFEEIEVKSEKINKNNENDDKNIISSQYETIDDMYKNLSYSFKLALRIEEEDSKKRQMFKEKIYHQLVRNKKDLTEVLTRWSIVRILLNFSNISKNIRIKYDYYPLIKKFYLKTERNKDVYNFLSIVLHYYFEIIHPVNFAEIIGDSIVSRNLKSHYGEDVKRISLVYPNYQWNKYLRTILYKNYCPIPNDLQLYYYVIDETFTKSISAGAMSMNSISSKPTSADALSTIETITKKGLEKKVKKQYVKRRIRQKINYGRILRKSLRPVARIVKRKYRGLQNNIHKSSYNSPIRLD